jgi:2-polyprenyl-3-methyl-5-hydroxy-6-metoxy-1,4-benzoquinol methylase
VEATNCSLCGANEPRRLHRNFNLEISKCGRCGFVYAGPQRVTREENWTRQSADYFHKEYLPALGVTNGGFDLEAFDRRYARQLLFIRPYRKLGTLLEFGIGAGFFLKAAERDGWRVLGLDVMEAGVEFARTRLGLDVRLTPIEDADIPHESFDVVAMFEVIEHLSDPKGVVRRAFSLLRPGGCLIVSTPNIESLTHRALGGQWSVLNPFEHLQFFSERTLRAMLTEVGFTDAVFDRHYAGAGRYETLFATHSFTPNSVRVRTYRVLVHLLWPGALHQIQALGIADGLHCIARKPG